MQTMPNATQHTMKEYNPGWHGMTTNFIVLERLEMAMDAMQDTLQDQCNR